MLTGEQLRTPRGAHWVIASLEVSEEWGVPSATFMSKPRRHKEDSEPKAIGKQRTQELSARPLCLEA